MGRWRTLGLSWWLLAACLMAASCAKRAPEPAVYRQSRAERQAEGLRELQDASAALRRGRAEQAEASLRRAVEILGTPPSSGEWTAMVGRESSKAWRGEPYERMGAYLTLGWLLYARGDLDNAIAMSKSALLSDTGTSSELWRSDLVSAWALQGLALMADGEVENGRMVLGRAADAAYARDTLDRLDAALQATPKRGPTPNADTKARLALFAALSAGVSGAPRDPQRAVDGTRSRAIELMQLARNQPKQARRLGLHRFSAADFDEAGAAIGPLTEAWRARVAASTAAGPSQRLANELERLGADPPNVVVLLQHGRGPTKTAQGEHREQLVIRPGVDSPAPAVTIDGRVLTPWRMDSTTFQATTRGGRRVDAWLRGKAIYRDTGLVTGIVLLYLSQELAYAGERESATVVAIAGAALAATAALTMPEADTRGWSNLPESWSLATAHMEPGSHLIRVGSDPVGVVVPPRGQVVIFSPVGGPPITGR